MPSWRPERRVAELGSFALKKNRYIYLYLVLGVIWISIGVTRGQGDFLDAYEFFYPAGIEFSTYSGPTISAEQLAEMRNGVRALLDCLFGVLWLVLAGGLLLKKLTEPKTETRE